MNKNTNPSTIIICYIIGGIALSILVAISVYTLTKTLKGE